MAQIQYLQAEIDILRSKLPKRVSLIERERQQLVKLGQMVGPALKHLISIVSYRTVQRWVANLKKPQGPRQCKRKPGRPRTPEEIRDLVLRIACEMNCGYSRVLEELKKLGVRSIGKTTVRNILEEAGLDPKGPHRGDAPWDQFLRSHTQTLWACDFLSKKVWTVAGLVDYYLLFFIHLETRQVIVSRATVHPKGEWVAQQARNFIMEVEDSGRQISDVIHD
ncbi:MAG: helix-turn-helix domain-containing protein [Phycisphaeraceae bacterium]|nr:helix-turn-helix domain-containing protein [Phycisphaeraceae bacterium]